jgi:hypothetical protein
MGGVEFMEPPQWGDGLSLWFELVKYSAALEFAK